MDAEKLVREKWRLLKATMDERARRLWAGAEAGAIGDGGVAAVARATGLAISTVRKGRDEARRGARPEDLVNVRRSGGKRPYEDAALVWLTGKSHFVRRLLALMCSRSLSDNARQSPVL